MSASAGTPSLPKPGPLWLRHGPLLASASLSALIGYTLAQVVWLLVPAPEVTTAPPPPVTTYRVAPEQHVDPGRQLASRHLMGRAAALDDGAPPVPVDAPDTRLNLTLRGLVYSPDPALALAIVDDGQRETHFRTGDELAGGAIVDAILPDRVILRRNGRHESLRLPEERLALDGTDTAVQPLDAGPVNGAGGRRPDRTAPAPDAEDAFSRQVTDLPDRLMSNPEDFVGHVQMQPYSEDGTMLGFRLQEGEDPVLWEQTGLEPGDIVTSINGMQLDSLDAGMRVMQEIGTADSLQLEILRDGESQSLQVEFGERDPGEQP